MRKGGLKRFFRYYWYRLNNGITPEERLRITLSGHEENFPHQHIQEKPNRPLINLVLFIVTFCTTTLAGSGGGDTLTEVILSGLPYSGALMFILGTHEMGHYLAAGKFGVKATLPYFIPFPSIVGTMGAVIKTKSPIPHRKALFYIGAMGPLPGFAASLAFSAAGIYMSQIQALPVPGDFPVPVFGNSLLFGLIVHIFHGPIPPGSDIFLHPLAWAGWIGFLVTSLNLMPIGQLDGGHILYALIGERQVYAGWASVACLVVLSFFWPGWIVWIVLTFLILMAAHPPVEQGPPLTVREKTAGWFCMAVLAMTFIPVPVELI